MLTLHYGINAMKRWLPLWIALLSAPLQAQTLRVCAEPWEPFIFRDTAGHPAGLAVEVLKAVESRSPYRFRYQFRSVGGCEKLLQHGQVDVFAFGSPTTPHQGWVTTQKLLVAWVLYAWVPADSPLTQYTRTAFPAGRRLAWVRDYDYPTKLQQDRNFTRVDADDSDAALELLANHRADLAFDDPAATETLPLSITRRIKRLDPLVASVSQPLEMRAALAPLRALIDQETVRWQQDGRLNAFYLHQLGIGLKDVQQKLD